MHLVVGLGNFGTEFEGTRHNVGFEVVDRLARGAGIPIKRRECRALTGRGRIDGVAVLLARPTTFMNASGEAVAALCQKTGIDLENLLVVSDDIDLPLGVLRLKPRGSSGQKGLKSVEQCLGSREFPRLRVGVSGSHYSRQRDLSDYVLERFSRGERPKIDDALDRAADAVRVWLADGIREAMNRFNAAPE